MKSLHLLIVCALVLAAAGARAELNPFTEAANLGLGKGMEIYNNTVSKPPTNAVVPGFSAGTQPQQSIFSGGKGDLASPGVTRSAACAVRTLPISLAWTASAGAGAGPARPQREPTAPRN